MNIEDLRPADTPEYMLPAWIGCMSWAIGTPEIVEAFRRDTGERWLPPRTPLDRMIDQATGADAKFIVAFIRWANLNVWGPVDGDQHAAACE